METRELTLELLTLPKEVALQIQERGRDEWLDDGRGIFASDVQILGYIWNPHLLYSHCHFVLLRRENELRLDQNYPITDLEQIYLV